jgi:transposase InsO family protein
MDFVSDLLVHGRRFRILCVIDDFSGECLAAIVDNSLSGERVTRELDATAGRRGYLLMVAGGDVVAHHNLGNPALQRQLIEFSGHAVP